MAGKSNLSSDCCILFGNESFGLSKKAFKGCNEAAAIPMSPVIDSLNVGSASAIFLRSRSPERLKE
jgi:tRNA G18 (ribose-2'-O)-methylase SpoU